MKKITFVVSLCLAQAVLVWVPGCGGADADRPPTYPVSGVISHGGQPVAGATLTFLPGDGFQHAATGMTDDAGRYTLTTFEAGDGATAGGYQVTVVKYEMPPLATDMVEEEDEPPNVNLLPDQYADGKTSGLTATITEAGPNTFDFELE